MTAQIKFDAYEFTVSALTEAGVAASLHFDVQETVKGIIATQLLVHCMAMCDGRIRER